MRLRGKDFPNIYNASGARNFGGSGYWYSPLVNWGNSGLVAKTTTLLPRPGNMPLKVGTWQPTELLPKCIKIYPYAGMVLNAVGLSGPGAERLLLSGVWQNWPDPFFISFMAVSDNLADRLDEMRQFVKLLLRHLKHFKAPVGLEINISCPNVGRDQNELIQEAGQMLDIAAMLKIPLAVKLSPVATSEQAVAIAKHKECDVIILGNTVPWGKLPDDFDWAEMFKSTVSPLAEFGGGGLSGAPLFPITTYSVTEFRECNAGNERVKLVACGGIMSASNAVEIIKCGADAIQLGTVAMLRPWRVGQMVVSAEELFRHQKRKV